MGDLITIFFAALAIWALCGLVVTWIVAADEDDPGFWDVFPILLMNLMLGPFAFLLLWFVTWSVNADRQQAKRQREQLAREAKRLERKIYVMEREWETTDPQELELLEAEYQRIEREVEERHNTERRQREQAILKQLRANQPRSRTRSQTRSEDGSQRLTSQPPPPKNWREARPLFWSDR